MLKLPCQPLLATRGNRIASTTPPTPPTTTKVPERFYIPVEFSAAPIRLEGDEAHHLARVARLQPGDHVALFNGRGDSCPAEILSLERGGRAVVLQPGPVAHQPKPPISLTLASAWPKGERADWLVAKATELGVDRLIPLRTERSVVDPGASKLDRLRRVVIESSKQCRRDHLLQITNPLDWPQLLHAETSTPTRLIAHPSGPSIAAAPLHEGPVLVAIGPEGGFTPAEVDSALQAGWHAVSFGPTILRIETAGLVAAACILIATPRNPLPGAPS